MRMKKTILFVTLLLIVPNLFGQNILQDYFSGDKESRVKESILKNSKGEMHIIDKAAHNGVRHITQSFTFIKEWFSEL